MLDSLPSMPRALHTRVISVQDPAGMSILLCSLALPVAPASLALAMQRGLEPQVGSRPQAYLRLVQAAFLGVEGQGGPWYHARHDGLPQALHQLSKDLILGAVGGVLRVDDEGVGCRHHPLHQDCHAQVQEVEAHLLHGQEGPLVVLGSPHALHHALLSQAWTGRLSRCTWKPTHPAPCTTQSGMDREALSLYLEAHTPCTVNYSVRHGQESSLTLLGSPHTLHRALLSQAWTGSSLIMLGGPHTLYCALLNQTPCMAAQAGSW